MDCQKHIVMNYTCCIGIDPGASGGIAIINNDLKLPQTFKMPKDVTQFRDILLNYKNQKTIVFIEKVSMWFSDNDNPGKQFRVRKMLDNYAELKTVVKLIGFDLVEVTPGTWLKMHGLKNIKNRTDRKNRNKTHANYFYPGMKITHAISDALLIMQYGIMKIQGGQVIQPKKTIKHQQGKLF